MAVEFVAIVRRVLERRSLEEAQAFEAMEAIAEGEVPEPLLAAFLAAFEAKGPEGEELAGFARSLRPRASRVEAPAGAVDTCGTGGDGADTFNVSTVAAFVVAGCGVPVAKHGNRSASGRCGSADVLERLGVPVDLDAEAAASRLRRDCFAFLFAPKFHPALARVAPLRRALGFRTIFNLLGPLLNPARVTRQVLGVPRADLVERVALALARLGVERAFVVHGGCGIDELSPAGGNVIREVRDGRPFPVRCEARELGLEPAIFEALRGGDATHNAALARAVLSGEKGARRDTILLNASAALVAAGAARDFAEGIGIARASIDEGRAGAVLERARTAVPGPPALQGSR